MNFTRLFSIALLSIIAYVTTVSTIHECRCGGHMPNGETPSDCFNGRCSVLDDSTYCATIYSNETNHYNTIIALACLPWHDNSNGCTSFDLGSRVCFCKPGSTCPNLNENENFQTSNSLFAETPSAQQATSGATVQLTTKGLDLAMQILRQRVGELRNVPIPDFEDETFDARVYNLKITEFTPPNLGYRLIPPTTVSLVSSAGYLRIGGQWEAFSHAIHGLVSARTRDGINANITINFIITSDGQLRIGLASCDFRVNLAFQGSIPFKFLSDGTEESVNKAASKKFCEILQRTIDEKVNPSLSTIPWDTRFDYDYMLDYQLINGGFSVMPNLIQSYFLGMVKWRDQPTPVQPSVYVPLESSAKMGYAYISDFVPNTYLYVAHSHSQLKYSFGEKDIAEKSRKYLRTSCTGEGLDVCAGSMIKELGDKYPNGTLEFHLKATSPPSIKITSTSVMLTGVGFLKMNVNRNLQPSVTVAKGNVTFDAQISPIVNAQVKPPILYGSAEIVDLGLSISKSLIGKISTEYMQAFMDTGRTALEVVLNKVLIKGVKLPLPNMPNIVNLEVHLIDNAVVTSFDATTMNFLECI